MSDCKRYRARTPVTKMVEVICTCDPVGYHMVVTEPAEMKGRFIHQDNCEIIEELPDQTDLDREVEGTIDRVRSKLDSPCEGCELWKQKVHRLNDQLEAARDSLAAAAQLLRDCRPASPNRKDEIDEWFNRLDADDAD